MDLPAVCLLLLERRTLVEYLGWVLLHSSSPLTICEAEEEEPITPMYATDLEIEPKSATDPEPIPATDQALKPTHIMEPKAATVSVPEPVLY